MTVADVLQSLLADDAISPFVDIQWDSPVPFVGSGEIKLIVIGQDPTVGRQVHTVLTLDEPNSNLRRFVSGLAERFGVSLDDNVYATNVCKNFFVKKPTVIKNDEGVDVIELTAPYWLPVLREELAAYPDAIVISLGEPILKVLVKSGSQQVKDYWGYRPGWNKKPEFLQDMSAIEAENSVLNRRIFPIPHQPTLANMGNRRGDFYRYRLAQYVDFSLNTHEGDVVWE